MGTVISNLKARFGVDTTDFRKGLKDGEKSLADFKDVGNESIDKFAQLFGINMSAVRDSLSTVGKSLNFVGQAFKGAAAGGDTLAISMKVLKVALMSTGIGALVVALGSLVSFFTQTEMGAKQLNKTMTQGKAVFQVYVDHYSKMGEAVSKLFTGKFKEAWELFKESISGTSAEIANARETAKSLADNVHDLIYEEMNYNRVKSEQEIIMAEAKLRSRDLDLSAKERLDALVKYSKVENEIDKKEIALLANKIVIAQQNLALDTQDLDKKKALNEAVVAYNNAATENIMNDYTLQREKNRLIKEIRAQEKAQLDLNKAQYSGLSKSSGKDYGGFGKDVSQTKLATMPNWKQGKSETQEFSQAAVEMADTVNSSLANMTGGISSWFGAYVAGVASAKDAKEMVGNSFGDMLIMLGETAIKTGIGIEAIKKAFASLSGVAAIGIGVALVSFGSFIKGSIQRAGSSASLSSSGGGGFTYDSRIPTRSIGAPVVVKHEVTMKQTGKDLSAVLVIEEGRKNSTT